MTCACCGSEDAHCGLDPETETAVAEHLARKVLSGEMSVEEAQDIGIRCSISWRAMALAMVREHVKLEKGAAA